MNTNLKTVQVAATFVFCLAIIHTFLVGQLHKLSRNFKQGSTFKVLFTLLSEVELVFALWSAVLLLYISFVISPNEAVNYLNSKNYSEPIFIFAVLLICSSKPVLDIADTIIAFIARLLPIPYSISVLIVTLTFGTSLGSFITEPAAMTVTAYILFENYFKNKISTKLKYAILGTLFVNISIGGTLTPYAAPPVLMVAKTFDWNLKFMFLNFGWKGLFSSIISSTILAYLFKKELSSLSVSKSIIKVTTPKLVIFIHLVLLSVIVFFAHYSNIVIGAALVFLAIAQATKKYQNTLRMKESLLVSLFLAGLVILGGFQNWWLEPIITKLNANLLYLGSIGLTAVVDNAALTYLGSLVPNLSDLAKYALVSGSVVGGGLTVIANAPNPVGYSILQTSFGTDGISPLKLFLAALPPTLIAMICFWFL